ncbi:hypothetical protein M0R72_15465 [Candidatus Pacearchaeota archaeon]|jgi:intein/homing endonuclease|nr:hypothetical protein [Candidatus Pacearchaeota archaeon]
MEQFSNADNQQASLCDLSWLGGIMDGEGCITIDKRSAKNRKQANVSPAITIVNTDTKIIDKVLQILKKYDIAYYYRVHPPKGNWKRKLEILIVGYKRVSRFIPVILPYLVGKYQRAVLIQQLCESRMQKPYREYSEVEKEICRKIWDLNGRGTKHW